MLLRRDAQTRTQRFGGEVSEGFDHLGKAATIAASGAAERIGPGVEMTREAAVKSWESMVAAVAPIVAVAVESARARAAEAEKSAREAGRSATKAARKRADSAASAARRRADSAAVTLRLKEPPKRVSKGRWLVGALALGAAAGVAGALVARRRASQWEEYEPEHPQAEATPGEGAPRGKVAQGVDAAKGKLAQGVDKARERTKSAAGRRGTNQSRPDDSAASGS